MTVASRVAGVILVTVGAACLWPRTGQTHGSITTTVLFDREIVGLLERRCVSCHNEGGLSFPLSTYEQTWVKRLSMRTEVLQRHMPPWSAVPGYGEFANDNGLTLRETQFLVSWVEGLGPRNAGTTFLNVLVGGQAPAAVRALGPRRRLAAGAAGSPAGAGLRHHPAEPSPGGATHDDRSGTDRTRARRRDRVSARRSPSLAGGPVPVGIHRAVAGQLDAVCGFAKLPQGVAFRLPAGACRRNSTTPRGRRSVTNVGAVGLFLASGASAAPSDLVVTARGTPGRSRMRAARRF